MMIKGNRQEGRHLYVNEQSERSLTGYEIINMSQRIMTNNYIEYNN